MCDLRFVKEIKFLKINFSRNFFWMNRDKCWIKMVFLYTTSCMYEVYSTEYRGCGKTPCPNFVRWWKSQKERITVKKFYVGPASLLCHRPPVWVWLSCEVKQNQWNILIKFVICYQLRPDVKTYGRPPRYTADADSNADTGQMDVCANKFQFAAASKTREIISAAESTADV